MAHSCGRRCGGGMHHFLEKVDGTWHEVKLPDIRQCEWVS
jgi:hypothetical protein